MSNRAGAPGDLALILGATMRLTRAVVTDDIGQWWVKDPLDAWWHERFNETSGQQGKWHVDHKYLGGLECPYCCGFWIGAGVLASHSVAKRVHLLPVWRFVAGALTLNEVAAHLGVKVGDFG